VRRNASGSNCWADRNALVCESGWRDGRSNEVDWRGGEDGPASEDDMVLSMRAILPGTGGCLLSMYLCVNVCASESESGRWVRLTRPR
jgi:hypothetical protein